MEIIGIIYSISWCYIYLAGSACKLVFCQLSRLFAYRWTRCFTASRLGNGLESAQCFLAPGFGKVLIKNFVWTLEEQETVALQWQLITAGLIKC